MIGWDLVLEYALGAATVAVSWSGHFIGFMHQLGIYPPPALSAAPGTLVAVASGDPVTAVFNLPAVIITGLVTALLVVGIKESATFNAVMVVIKVSVVGVVIAVGVFFIAAAEPAPVHSREHRHVRRVRLERDHARRGGDLLLLHRL